MDGEKNLTKAVYLIPLWLMYGEILAAWRSGFELPVKSGSCLMLLIFFGLLYSVFHAVSSFWEKSTVLGNALTAAVLFIMPLFGEVREQLEQLFEAINTLWNRAYGIRIVVTSVRHARTDCTLGFFWLIFLFFCITLFLFWKEAPLIWQMLPGVVLFLVPVISDGKIPSTATIGFFCGMLLFLTRVGQKGKNVIPAFGIGAAMLILSTILVSLFFSERKYNSMVENNGFEGFVSEQTELLEEVFEGGNILQGEFDADGKLEYQDITMYQLTTTAREGNIPYIYLKSFEGIRYNKGRWLGLSSRNNISYTGTVSHLNSNTWKIVRVAGKEDVVPYGDEVSYNVEKGAVVRNGGTWASYQTLVCHMERHWAEFLARPIVKTEAYQKEREVPKSLQKVCNKRMQSIHAGTYQELADAIKEMFIKKFRYSQEPGKPDKNKDELLYFLQESHKGYCVHFSSAAVFLFRSYGIPARYAQGYTVDTTKLMLNRAYSVKDYMSHAWVEINIDGLWVPIDVTPGRSEDYFSAEGNGGAGEDAVTGAGVNGLQQSSPASTQSEDEDYFDSIVSRIKGVISALLYRISQFLAAAALLALLFLSGRYLYFLWQRRKLLQLAKKEEWKPFLQKLHGEFLRHLAAKKVLWDEYSRETTSQNVFYAFSADIPFVYENDMRDFQDETQWYVDKMFSLRYGDASVSRDEVLRAVRWYKKIIKNKKHFVFRKVFELFKGELL